VVEVDKGLHIVYYIFHSAKQLVAYLGLD